MEKRAISIGLVVLAAASYGVFAAFHLNSAQTPIEPRIPVVAATVGTADVPVELTGIGSVQAYNTVTVRSRVDGAIVKVSFTEGQAVKAGDPLFTIDPRPFQAVLEQAQATQRKDESLLADAKLDLDRYTSLLGHGFQTRQSYDQQQALVVQYQASIAADQAAIDTAKLNLAYADIRAPIDGRTGARLVDCGNLIQSAANTPLVTIATIHPIFVTFTLPQDDLDMIVAHQRQAPLPVKVYGEDDQTLLGQGVLTLIDNQVDATTGTLRFKARFDNTDERLWPGAFVSAHLIVSTLRNATVVPIEAIVQGPAGPYAYVVGADSRATRRALQTGISVGGMTVVDRGLEPGDRVVVDGQYRLTQGSLTRLVSTSQRGNGAT